MGFWTNWKEKRKDKKPLVAEEATKKPPASSKKKKKEATVASALEENENQKYHRQVVENFDSEIAKSQQQPIDDLIEDPHLHSQGFISPKQGVHILVDEVMDKEQPNLQKKKKRPPNKIDSKKKN